MKKRNWLRAALALSAAWALTPMGAMAQGYPNRSVRIVVPFAAGGPADNYARFIAQRLGDEFKQSFVIDNRPGAAGNLAGDIVARAPADGRGMKSVLRNSVKEKKHRVWDQARKIDVTPEGIEPPTFRSGVERATIAPRSHVDASLEQ